MVLIPPSPFPSVIYHFLSILYWSTDLSSPSLPPLYVTYPLLLFATCLLDVFMFTVSLLTSYLNVPYLWSLISSSLLLLLSLDHLSVYPLIISSYHFSYLSSQYGPHAIVVVLLPPSSQLGQSIISVPISSLLWTVSHWLIDNLEWLDSLPLFNTFPFSGYRKREIEGCRNDEDEKAMKRSKEQSRDDVRMMYISTLIVIRSPLCPPAIMSHSSFCTILLHSFCFLSAFSHWSFPLFV